MNALDPELIKVIKTIERYNPQWRRRSEPGSSGIECVIHTPEGDACCMIKTGTYSRAQGLSSHYIRVSIEQQGVTIFQKDYLMGGSIRRKSFFWRDEIWEDVESEEYKYLASYIERIIDPNRQKRIAETEAKKREEEKLKAEKEVNLRKKFFQD